MLSSLPTSTSLAIVVNGNVISRKRASAEASVRKASGPPTEKEGGKAHATGNVVAAGGVTQHFGSQLNLDFDLAHYIIIFLRKSTLDYA